MRGAENRVDAKEETKTHVDVRFHARKVFFLRAKIIRFIRQYLEEREYLEVETPILSTRSGGANAVPFTTQLRSMDPSDPNGKTSLYLRIAPELYLKQLVIGGIERVYELGKQFRNEGFDHNHNPEFTTCELYQAYADCESYMTMTEDLLSSKRHSHSPFFSFPNSDNIRRTSSTSFQSLFSLFSTASKLSLPMEKNLTLLRPLKDSISCKN